MRASQDRVKKGMWWDRAWSLVEGCTPIDKECEHCWAAQQTHLRRNNTAVCRRYEGLTFSNGKFNGCVRLMRKDLIKLTQVRTPKVWSIWNDLFHEGVPFNFIYKAVEMVYHCHQHFVITCTKRPARAALIMPEVWFQLKRNYPDAETPLPNLMGMTTAGYQGSADIRVPQLLNAPFALRGVSIEPMLGPVDLQFVASATVSGGRFGINSLAKDAAHLDWVICGGESGPGARPMHPAWPKMLRDQCVASGVPFFFKQWGAYGPDQIGRVRFTPVYSGAGMDEPESMFRVGKKKAGRLLDGRAWDQFPEVRTHDE